MSAQITSLKYEGPRLAVKIDVVGDQLSPRDLDFAIKLLQMWKEDLVGTTVRVHTFAVPAADPVE